MRVLKLSGKTGNSSIMLGESIFNLGKYCDLKNAVIITDRNVRAALGTQFPECEIIEIGTGEQNKTLKGVEEIYGKLLELGVERSVWIIGIGGGIVCDVAGFAASTYLRGVRFGFVPTTLLAQVDASIGGKNGVNFKGYKNLIGTFRQPEFVLCDFELLKTLPVRELGNGFAETVKHGAVGDTELFAYLEENCQNALNLHRTAIEKIVYDSLMVKTKIVSAVETEIGERRKLNFGHTIGHAIEKTAGLPHGEAISIGMVAAARLSAAKGMLAQKDAQRIESLLAKLGLPTKIKAGKRDIMDAIEKDKKRESVKINFVLLDGIGKSKVVGIPLGELGAIVDDLR